LYNYRICIEYIKDKKIQYLLIHIKDFSFLKIIYMQIYKERNKKKKKKKKIKKKKKKKELEIYYIKYKKKISMNLSNKKNNFNFLYKKNY